MSLRTLDYMICTINLKLKLILLFCLFVSMKNFSVSQIHPSGFEMNAFSLLQLPSS